jgi:hypothetical protein
MEVPKVDLPESLAERLRSQREQRTAPKETTLKVPGFDELYARYLPLGYRPARKIVEDCIDIPDPATRDLEAAVQTLLTACQGVEAHIDGETHDLGMKLGKALADFLGLEGSENDKQAIMLIFPSEMAIMNQAVEVEGLSNETSDDQIVKNSVAAV